MSSAHATKQEIDEFFKHTKASAANKVCVCWMDARAVGTPGERARDARWLAGQAAGCLWSVAASM